MENELPTWYQRITNRIVNCLKHLANIFSCCSSRPDALNSSTEDDQNTLSSSTINNKETDSVISENDSEEISDPQEAQRLEDAHRLEKARKAAAIEQAKSQKQDETWTRLYSRSAPSVVTLPSPEHDPFADLNPLPPHVPVDPFASLADAAKRSMSSLPNVNTQK